MQKALLEKGSLTVAMTVYEDFELYSGGVYQHVTGKPLGGHAIKLIGWGVEEINGELSCTLISLFTIYSRFKGLMR